GEGDALGRENTVPLDRCDGEEGASNLPLDEAAAIGEGVLRVRDVVGRSSDPQPPLPPDLDLLCESHPPVELLLTRAGVTGELPGEHRVGREEACLGESTARGVEIGPGCAQSG